MKKFLSLVLALVMTMSLVTISAGAKDFTDNSKINYKEAVDVMSAVKVIDGYADGSFNPQGTLTRGAAAKIICNLILGPTTASALSADTAPYKDVPVNHTFAGYIAYCQQKGIISGYADGTFRPAGTLTSYAFMKMLLGALGYDASIEGYVGDNWSIQVAKQALSIGLDDDLVGDFIGTNAVTREEACLYALNTMTATMVEYSAKTTVNVSGAVVTVAGSDAKPVEWDTGSKRDGNIGAKDGFIQFAEQYFSDLKLDDDATDDFARPANEWKLKAEKIGTYTHTPDASYTKKVEVGDIYKDLGLGSSIAKADVEVYVDGVEDASQTPVAIKKGDDNNKYGGNGVLTEVFYDKNDDSVIITEINTFVGTVVKSVAAKGNKDAYVVVATEAPVGAAQIADKTRPDNVTGNVEFTTDEEFEDDAYVLYTYSQSAEEVMSLAVAEKVSGTVTRTENDKEDLDAQKSLVIDGETYKASKHVAGEAIGDVTLKNDYVVYLDAYGYMIYVEEDEFLSSDYALVLDAAQKSTFVGKKAELLFTDGTTKVVTTAKNYTSMVDADGDGTNDTKTIVTYKVDEDGVYTLKAVNTTVVKQNEDDFSMINDKAGITVDGTVVTANSATVFVVKDNTTTDDEYNAYTGIKNAPTVSGVSSASNHEIDAYYYCKNGKMVTVMFLFPESGVTVEDDNGKYLFLANKSVSNLINDDDGNYFEYSAVVDGELKTVKVAEDVKIRKADGTTVQLGATHGNSGKAAKLDGLYKSYATDKHGIITTLREYTNSFDNIGLVEQILQSTAVTKVEGIDKVSKEYTVILDTKNHPNNPDYTITVDEDADIFYVDKKGNISEIDYKSIAVDDNDEIYAVIKDYLVQTLVIKEVAAAAVPYGVSVTSSNAVVKVDGSTVANGSSVAYDKDDEDVVITATPAANYEFTTAPTVDGVDMTKQDNGSYTYTISKVRRVYSVVANATQIPEETMDILVTITTDDNQRVQYVKNVKASEAVGGWATITPDLTKLANGSDYEAVNGSEMVKFVAGGQAQVSFTAKKIAFDVTFAMGSALSGRTGAALDKTSAKVKVGDTVTVTFTETNTGWTPYTNGTKVTGDSDVTVTKTGAVANTPTDNGFAITFTIDAVSGNGTVTVDYQA